MRDSSCSGTTNADDEVALRKALQYEVLTIVLQQDATSGLRTTSGAVRALTELVWQYVQHALVPDLVAFSNHAAQGSSNGNHAKPKGRAVAAAAAARTISKDDVALLLRKLPDKLEQFRHQFPSNSHVLTTITTTTRHSNSRSLANNKSTASPSSADVAAPSARPLARKRSRHQDRTQSKHPRDREREFQALLESSDDDENENMQKGGKRGHDKPKPPPRRSDSSSSSSSSSSDDDNLELDLLDATSSKLDTTAAQRRKLLPPTRKAQRHFLDDMTPLSPMEDDGENRTLLPAKASKRKDALASPSALLNDTNDTDHDLSIKLDVLGKAAAIATPTAAKSLRSKQASEAIVVNTKRRAILDDDDDNDDSIGQGFFSRNNGQEEDRTNAATKNKNSTIQNHRCEKEPAKSQVADILANILMDSDSGPEHGLHDHDDDDKGDSD